MNLDFSLDQPITRTLVACGPFCPSLDSNSTFASIRTRYTQDPDWPKVEAHLRGGPAPTFTYHRFWAQADIALANATFAILYPDGIKGRPVAEPEPSADGKPGKGKSRRK